MKKSDINIKRKGEKETMEKEKKQIKISLWTFYVLVAGIVILIGAIIIGGMNVKKKMDSLEQGQESLTNKVVQEEKNGTVETADKVENVSKNDANAVKEENFEDVTLDDKDVQKCLNSELLECFDSLYFEAKQQNNKLTKENISNDLILRIGMNKLYYELEELKEEELMNTPKVSSFELDKEIKKIFGNEIQYVHQDFPCDVRLGTKNRSCGL